MSNDEPIGNHCPGCGQHAYIITNGGELAFCRNDKTCHVLTWNPTQSVNEIAANSKVIDLPDWLSGGP